MLLKIETHEVYNEWDNKKQAYAVKVEDQSEVWIDPERVSRIRFKTTFDGYAEIRCGTERFQVTEAEARRIIDQINNQTPAPAAPAPAPLHKTVEILSMTRDRTKNSGSPFWRCGTSEGFTVNVFKHDDPLKDNFNLFDHAGYAPEMINMNYGDTITWTRDKITVEIEQNGAFWNVVRVLQRADGALPDEPEPDDDDTPTPESDGE